MEISAATFEPIRSAKCQYWVCNLIRYY